jgi:hypothetical protein
MAKERERERNNNQKTKKGGEGQKKRQVIQKLRKKSCPFLWPHQVQTPL